MAFGSRAGTPRADRLRQLLDGTEREGQAGVDLGPGFFGCECWVAGRLRYTGRLRITQSASPPVDVVCPSVTRGQ